jgi:hypothetical protein
MKTLIYKELVSLKFKTWYDVWENAVDQTPNLLWVIDTIEVFNTFENLIRWRIRDSVRNNFYTLIIKK